jgi:hypothetical protein
MLDLHILVDRGSTPETNTNVGAQRTREKKK